ncbi:tetraacyldisaccharide 4'-kinase [bacterium]|jgi:lipid-A-disaccharide synthase|nr:tetraacyldisaccharide 4'-kinase [bacterium]
MRVFVSAAEISSDIHAEKIVRAFRELNPVEPLEVFGIGGPRLRSVDGFRVLARAEDLRSMGFVEVLRRLFVIRGIRDRVVAALRSSPPDVILTFDYPDFHFSMMRILSREPWFASTLKVCGIPPKVWVWRKRRVETIRRLYDGVWVIFPFEKEFYEKQGIPVIFEGNPLIADLLEENRDAPPVHGGEGIRVAVLPGSRDAELARHLPIIPEALSQLSLLLDSRVIAEVPVPDGVSMSIIEAVLVSNDRVWYRLIPNGSSGVLARNPIGLVKSGTSTLEAAVLGCVPVIFYRMSRWSEWIFRRVVRYGGPVGLPNILLGVRSRADCEFPELLGQEANAKTLALELARLVQDREHFEDLRKKGLSLRDSLVPAPGVARRTAMKIGEWLALRPIGRIGRRASLLKALGSFCWSSVNRLRRIFYPRPALLPLPSILVGNLQAGGAGKTPFVIALAREAVRRGLRVGIVSRGYGGSYPERVRLVSREESPALVGDEVAEMTKELPGMLIALSSDRRRAAQALKEEGVELVLADDGFQNLRFRCDLTVLLLTDASRSEILYRDFDSEAAGADLVLQTKGRGRALPGAQEPFERLEWEPGVLPRQPVWIWSGIGDPSELVHFYRSHGVRIGRVISARDHAQPDPPELRTLMQEARRQGALLAVTPKDAVKIPSDILEGCFILRRHLKAGPALDRCWDRIFQGLQSLSEGQ